MLIYR